MQVKEGSVHEEADRANGAREVIPSPGKRLFI